MKIEVLILTMNKAEEESNSLIKRRKHKIK